MKKLLLLGPASALVFSSAYANDLEDRVTNLEFANYSNYTTVGGSLEYQIDSYSMEDKDNDVKSATGYESVFFDLDLASQPSDRLSFYAKVSSSFFANTLSDRNYGEYYDFSDKTVVINPLDPSASTSTQTEYPGSPYLTREEDSPYYAMRRGSVQSSTTMMLTRAFANYKFRKNLTFTFGRLPTSHGAPTHFTQDTTRMGNYPLMSFGGHWDGMALSYGFAKNQTLKFIYTPAQNIDLASHPTSTSLYDANGDKITTKSPAYTMIYEMEKSNFAGARGFYFLASYYKMNKLYANPHAPTKIGTADYSVVAQAVDAATGGAVPYSGTASDYHYDLYSSSDLRGSLDKLSIYGEFLGVANTKFDVAFHAASMNVKSEGSIKAQAEVPAALQTAYGDGILSQTGYLTDSDDESMSGTAYGLLVRYAFKPNIKLGWEYFTATEDTFLYNPTNAAATDIYTTHGSAQHLFYNHAFEGGFKITAGWILKNRKYTRALYEAFGAAQEVDIVDNNAYLKLTTKF